MATKKFQYDEEGNLAFHIDHNGRRIQRIYNVFGSPIYEKDQQTEQYYLRARYYNPLLGRFTQEENLLIWTCNQDFNRTGGNFAIPN